MNDENGNSQGGGQQAGLMTNLNITAYLAGAVSSMYESHLGKETQALQKAAKGAFANKRAIAKAIDFNKAMAKGMKVVGEKLFGVGVVLSAIDVVDNKFSASSVSWATLDTAMGAVGVWGGPVGAGVLLIYATGRIGYEVYEDCNNP